MNRDVIGLVALDEILGFFFSCVARVAFEFDIGKDFLHDSAANSTCFRVPFDVIATFEDRGHLSVVTEPKRHSAKRWSKEKRCQPCPQHHAEYHLLALAFDQSRVLPTDRQY